MDWRNRIGDYIGSNVCLWGSLIMGLYSEDRYYEPEDCDESEEIQERIDYELKNANYPYSKENILECICEDGLIPHLETLAGLLVKGDMEAVGVVLSAAIYTYWEDRTECEVLENI